MIAFLIAAADFSAPTAINPNAWFGGFLEHPKEGPPTVIAAEITVTPRGSPASCHASTIIGDPNWAPFTCDLIKRRGFFKPARIDGRPIYGVYRLRTAWVQRGPAPKDVRMWDFEVPLDDALGDLELPALGKIKFVVDVTGSIRLCSSSPDWKRAELEVIACAQLARKFKVEPAKTQSGETVESVQDAAVRFVRGPSKR